MGENILKFVLLFMFICVSIVILIGFSMKDDTRKKENCINNGGKIITQRNGYIKYCIYE